MEKHGRLICSNRNVWGVEAPPRRTLGSRVRASLETGRALAWWAREVLTLGDVVRIILETIFVAAVLYFLIML